MRVDDRIYRLADQSPLYSCSGRLVVYYTLVNYFYVVTSLIRKINVLLG